MTIHLQIETHDFEHDKDILCDIVTEELFDIDTLPQASWIFYAPRAHTTIGQLFDVMRKLEAKGFVVTVLREE